MQLLQRIPYRSSDRGVRRIATGSGASVEHDLIAGESIQNVVDDLSIIQMFPPLWKHIFDSPYAVQFGHGQLNATISRSDNLAFLCLRRRSLEITQVIGALFHGSLSDSGVSGQHDCHVKLLKPVG